MTNELRGRAAVVGVGETDYSRNSGRSELMLSLQAIQAALDDAGLKPSDVDGLMKWSVDTSLEADVAANLGMKELTFFGEINQAGNVGAALVGHAAAAIDGPTAPGHALVISASCPASGTPADRSARRTLLSSRSISRP